MEKNNGWVGRYLVKGTIGGAVIGGAMSFSDIQKVLHLPKDDPLSPLLLLPGKMLGTSSSSSTMSVIVRQD
jgi:hypothetical protein